ncbi:hypothetical protein OG792_05050 [Micromonospora sp. NBC_01699]|uniref:hypothetical protein n=1 Tax=Micromonospora sp. NBC_01699 TaxID=2975984 RepID=UPI002E30B029|nr:hypothetical protein [Micromonospora sp. NBC_01699]
MGQTPAEWLESQADRTFARQRAQVDTAKLLATFASATAATLVASALQVGKVNTLELLATIFLGVSFIAVILIILLDRITEADQARVLELSHLHGWDEHKLLTELRAATLKAANANVAVVRAVQWMLGIQIAFAATTGAVAAVSLLSPGAPN